jgi:phosphotransferase system enzyme I (PtsI)
VLQLIARTIETANRSGKHVSVCGEMAGDTTFTELLLAMGLRSFSMQPSQIASVKQRVLRADVKRLTPRLAPTLLSDEPLQAWLRSVDPLLRERAIVDRRA